MEMLKKLLVAVLAMGFAVADVSAMQRENQSSSSADSDSEQSHDSFDESKQDCAAVRRRAGGGFSLFGRNFDAHGNLVDQKRTGVCPTLQDLTSGAGWLLSKAGAGIGNLYTGTTKSVKFLAKLLPKKGCCGLMVRIVVRILDVNQSVAALVGSAYSFNMLTGMCRGFSDANREALCLEPVSTWSGCAYYVVICAYGTYTLYRWTVAPCIACCSPEEQAEEASTSKAGQIILTIRGNTIDINNAQEEDKNK